MNYIINLFLRLNLKFVLKKTVIATNDIMYYPELEGKRTVSGSCCIHRSHN